MEFIITFKVQNFLAYWKCFFRYESVLGGYPDFPDIHLRYHPRYQKYHPMDVPESDIRSDIRSAQYHSLLYLTF
jgi:hypothetical protein